MYGYSFNINKDVILFVCDANMLLLLIFYIKVS